MEQIFQDGFSRIERALQGVVDRIPFTAQMHEFSMAHCGIPARRFYTDADALISAILRTAADFDFDVPGLGFDAYNIEAEALGQPLVFEGECSPTIDKERVLIREEADLDRLRPPDPGCSGRMPFVLEVNRLYLERTGRPPALNFCAPFSLAVIVRGYEKFIEDLYFRPEFARRLLTFLTEEVLAPWIRVQKQGCPPARLAIGADAIASPPLVNLELIREFNMPFLRRLGELCEVKVVVRNWWGDSQVPDPEELLELKRQVGGGVIQGQDPDTARLGPELFKSFARRHDLSLVLGVGDGLLNAGPVPAIEAAIRRYLEAGAPGGKFHLYLCNLSAVTPPDHVRAAVRAIRRYGNIELS